MKVYKSLKKVPVTKMFQSIITAYTSDVQDYSSRTPFIVYLPCGKEGIAVGCPSELVQLMSAQTEGQTDGGWKIVDRKKEPTFMQAQGELGEFPVTFIIEPVVQYTVHQLEVEEAQSIEEADYENDTL